MQTLIQDVRYGFRMMAKAPGVSALAVLSLALGIGANTALFSVVDGVLLRMLPVKDPEQLVLFNWQAGKAFRTTGLRGTFASSLFPEGMRGGSPFHARMFAQMRDAQRRDPSSPLQSVFAFADLREVSLLADGQAEVVGGQLVSGNYFTSLGVAPALGRLLNEMDDTASAAPAAVISDGLWRQRFGADPSIIGRELKLNQHAITIVGVTPASFVGPWQVDFKPEVTLPIALSAAIEGERAIEEKPGKPGAWWLSLMGRLKPGVGLAQAQAALDPSFQALAIEMMPPPSRPDQPVVLTAKDQPHLLALPGGRGMREIRSIYLEKVSLLFVVVGLVLAIACANVANLLLTRATVRIPEVTVRLAMGAGRGRLIRQLLTESVLLSLLGGALGAVFAIWGRDALMAAGAGGVFLPADANYALNWRVLGFTFAVATVTGVLFGLAPALRSAKVDLAPALKDSARAGGAASRSWLTRGLVVAQVAISLVLLVGAGLFVSTLGNLQRVDVGFNQKNILLFSLQPSSGGYKGERLTQIYEQVAEKLEGLPGVVSATFAQMPLVARYFDQYGVLLPGETESSGPEHSAAVLIVRENFLTSMQIPLNRGRSFTAKDAEAAPKVAIVNEIFARKFFPLGGVLGKRVGFDAATLGQIEIVGVSRDITYNSQAEERDPLIILPWRQQGEMPGGMTFSLRSTGDPVALTSAVRGVIRDIDPSLPLRDLKTQLAQSEESLSEHRLYARLVSVFGGLALLLASIGLFAVMAYSVAERTPEIGIRMALGARGPDVLRGVLRQGLLLVAIGLVVGGAAAIALKRLVTNQLFGIDPGDPSVVALAASILVAASLLACLGPARRATLVDPMTALRRE